jgi:thiosulfate dehydrogenase [quinone] large subunit
LGGNEKIMNFSRPQLTSLVVLRLLIGWHFLYEGVTKLFNPYWTAKSYLLTAEGVLQPFFVWLAGESMIGAVNVVNMVLLIGVGLALMLGTLTRVAAVAGIVLLLMYYLAHPPLHGMSMGPGTGNFWIVNYNLIEIAALLLLYHFPTNRVFGLAALRGRPDTQH